MGSTNSTLESKSSVEPKMDSNSAMKDLLECHVCMTTMHPPIHQCRNGHAICFKCKLKIIDLCQTCRGELVNIRCLALEKLAGLLKIPCKFKELGCQGIFSYPIRVDHEKICSFRPYNCPYSECSVTGGITFLAAHLKKTHCASMLDSPGFYVTLKIPNPVVIKNPVPLYLLMINCLGHWFYLKIEAFTMGNDPVFMAFVGFMGNETRAEKFTYTLEVGGNERVLTWKGIPRSIRKSNKTVRDSLDGLIIQKKNLVLFFGDGQELELTVKGSIQRKISTILSISAGVTLYREI